MRRPRLLVTLGDPCGIGPELLLRSLATLHRWADVTVVGARSGVELLEPLPGPVAWTWEEAASTGQGRPLWRLRTAEGGEALWFDPTPEITAADLYLGRGSAASGRAAVEAVRLGAQRVLAGQADALTTLPLAKAAAHAAGYDLPGHTEFLQELSGAPITRMAFVSPRLNVALHTVHQSLRSVIEGLSAPAVADTLVFAAERFAHLTGKARLRVALCALNPHAGEGGAFGGEEALLREALAMANETLRERLPDGPICLGPLPSDSLFHRAAQGDYDLVVALYHDQGLIPIKVLEPDRAVNLTLGLPFVRTSPDHGTAFDRAGTWTAASRNFLEAAALALRLAGQASGQPWGVDVDGA